MTNKDFIVKNGIQVRGSTATVAGNSVLTTASAIEDLSNIDLSVVQDGQVLTYSSSLQKWIAEDGTAGEEQSLTIEVSDTPPSSPSPGATWYDSSTAKVYFFYEDLDSSQWVEIGTSEGPKGEPGTSISAGKSIAMAIVFG